MISKSIFRVAVFVFLVAFISSFVIAQPTGTDITFNETDVVEVSEPDERTDEGGTITTLVVDALQQNPRWKAYIGNITGSLTLDDSDGNTIFNWALNQSSITGEIYSSRSDSISWSDISCAVGAIGTEEGVLNIDGSSVDSISNTFNETTHPTINVNNQDHDNCPATSTFVNSEREAQAAAEFPLVLLQDTTDLIYVTPINPSTTGYDGSSLFDFQMIMANDPGDTTTYYFYVELGG